MRTLADVQQRLWRLISAPDGVAAALAAEGTSQSELGAWIVDDTQLDAVRRLDVYANAYFQRILECLEQEFGALAAAVGEQGFHDLVTAYLIAHPSRHASLRFIGAALPDYLTGAPQAEPFRRRWPWAADLARLEWALSCAFDAADAAPTTREELARAGGDRWEELVLTFHAAVTRVETEWPIHAMYSRWCADEPFELPAAPAPACVCVWRNGETVRHRALDPLETTLLRAALAGTSFGALCELADDAGSGEPAAARAAACLGRWVDDGLVVAMETHR